MRCTSPLVLGSFVMLWVGCEAEDSADDSDAGGAGAFHSGASAGASGVSGVENGAGTQGGAAGSGSLSTECEASPAFPPACNECFQSNCQQPCVDMQNHPEAKAVEACLQACADDACIDTCVSAHPTYSAAVESFFACMEEKCCETCTCCVCEPCSISTGDDECDACIYGACLDACVNVEVLGFTAYAECHSECEHDACREECDLTHPEVATALNELWECAQTACSTVCGDVLRVSASDPTNGSISM